MKTWVSALFMATVLSANSAMAETMLEKIQSAGKIVVATEAAFKPIEYVEDGKIVGFGSDLLVEVVKDLGVEVEQLDVPFQGMADHAAHYRNAEAAVRKIVKSGATLISLGGDHGIPIPILRGMQELGEKITLVQVDAHIDWRDEINGEHDGYSSPIRRASELDWIGDIIQIGIRGVGSARTGEVEFAKAYGADIITAYEMHDMGMQAVLDRIPDGGPYYLTVDADGLDPTIMPGVISQTPGGLTWVQMHKLIHGLVKKGRVIGMDLVEIAPSRDVGCITMAHAERVLCNFIGATVRAGYYDKVA